MTQIQSYANDDVQKVLVANKVDLEDERQVQHQEGLTLAEQFGIPFYETSAQADINVTQVFEQIARQIKKNSHQFDESQNGVEQSTMINKSKHKGKSKDKGDCC